MKSKKTIVMLSALAALCLTSCSNDDEISVNDGAVRFTASIGPEAVATPQSRAAGKEWHAGDKIGIFMVKHAATELIKNSENKEYTTAKGNKEFTPIAGNEIYYPMDNSAVDFIAYYPYKADTKLGTTLPVEIAANQTDDTQRNTDLMWAKANNADKGYTKDEKTTVDFTFGHCLSKLTMNCKLDASVGAPTLLAAATVTIHGMNTRSSFDLATGTLSGTPDTPMDIISRKLSETTVGYDGTYDAIILPGDYGAGAVTVDFKIDNEIFKWKVDPITFEPGKDYVYEVTITRTGVVVTGTIVDWQHVDKGGVTAE